jgi:hypothetical protein
MDLTSSKLIGEALMITPESSKSGIIMLSVNELQRYTVIAASCPVRSPSRENCGGGCLWHLLPVDDHRINGTDKRGKKEKLRGHRGPLLEA